jgi:hypothetical protein
MRTDLNAEIAMLRDEGLTDEEICEELKLVVLPNGHKSGWWVNEAEVRERSYRWDEERLVALSVELAGEAPVLPKTFSRSALVLGLAKGVIEARGGCWVKLNVAQKEAALAWGKLALQAFEIANRNFRSYLTAVEVEKRMKL